MRPETLPLAGRCRCGRVTFEVTAPPVMTAVCHCTGCQRMSSSAFSLTAIFPAEAFSVVTGETVTGGLRGPDLQHHFCPDCMTWMFTRIAGVDALVNVRPTLLDDHGWFSPFLETMAADRLDWVETPARHSFDGMPTMEEFTALVEAFAATG